MAHLEALEPNRFPHFKKKKILLPIGLAVGATAIAAGTVTAMQREGESQIATGDSTRPETTTQVPPGLGSSKPPEGITIEPSPKAEAIAKIQASRETVNYFRQVAMKVEYGPGGEVPVMKWETDPIIRIHGNPSAENLATLQRTIEDFNGLQDQVDLSIANEDTPEDKVGIDMYFVPSTEFKSIDPSLPGQADAAGSGWFSYTSNPDALHNPGAPRYKAKVLVATNANKSAQGFNTRVELTQALGFRNDVDVYPDSVFRQNPLLPGQTEFPQAYSVMDQQIISLLYNPQIKDGMNASDLQNVIEITP